MGRLLRAAVTAQSISAARTNRAVRKNIESNTQQAQQQSQAAPQDPQMQQAPVADAPAVDYAAELQKLADLRDKGILTEEEFTQKKQEILAKM